MSQESADLVLSTLHKREVSLVILVERLTAAGHDATKTLLETLAGEFDMTKAELNHAIGSLRYKKLIAPGERGFITTAAGSAIVRASMKPKEAADAASGSG